MSTYIALRVVPREPYVFILKRNLKSDPLKLQVAEAQVCTILTMLKVTTFSNDI